LRPPCANAPPLFNTRFLHNNAVKMDPREEALQGAIRDLNSSVYTSVRAAAKA
jgi:hypothetical protein